MELKLTRTEHENHLFFNVTQEVLLIGITGGWSVGMIPKDAISLVNSGKISKGSLTTVGRKVVLAHGDARLMLTTQETEQMKMLIAKAPWFS